MPQARPQPLLRVRPLEPTNPLESEKGVFPSLCPPASGPEPRQSEGVSARGDHQTP